MVDNIGNKPNSVSVTAPNVRVEAKRRPVDSKEVEVSKPVAKADDKAVETVDTVSTEESLSKETVQEISRRQVEDAVRQVEAEIQSGERSLNFEVSERENRVIVTVIDEETNEVIRTIPPEEMVELAERIAEGKDILKDGVLIQSQA